MIRKISVRGFKSLQNLVDLELPQMSVFFGPNAAGKSNVIDAIQALSRFATCRTLSDALQEPIRGYPIETFSFPSGGLRCLLDQEQAAFELGVLVQVERDQYEYKLGIEIIPSTGALSVTSEYLAAIGSHGRQKGNALIEPNPDAARRDMRIRRISER